MNKYIPPDFEAIKKANAGDSAAMQKRLLFFFAQNFMKQIDDEIQAAKKEIDQLTHRQDRLVSKLKVEERKKRTRRLIQRDAILESITGNATDFTNE